ncbi:serine hydrolase domain-containing protein [Nocardia ninae]|uniref:serine hydrolase domain-containing protein n=1 Tax=Nocardia ninae TaxID=356145 RepID=UPI001FEB11F7|nr:serine hydrolase domain-containing protein [Nocardia ninae]
MLAASIAPLAGNSVSGVNPRLLFGLAMAAALLTTTVACGRSDEPAPVLSVEFTQAVDRLLQQHIPGVQVVVTADGKDAFHSVGAGNVATGTPIPDDARIRIASNTKSFVATVVLQLVAEGRVGLDVPVERYLPGVVAGNGYDGNRITVRNLLQHTGGLPNYLDPDKMANSIGNRHRQPFDTEQVVRETLREKAPLPGAQPVYSNTGYLLAGLVVERVTGRSIGTEISKRIIEPLGLSSTYYPEPGESTLRAPHIHGYDMIDGKLTDVTELDDYGIGGADSALVSTGADLNRFFIALLGGRLLAPQLLAEMKSTVPADLPLPGLRGVGLGLFRYESSCGTEFWGHGGGAPGFGTLGGVTPDGRAVTLTVNFMPSSEQAMTAISAARDTALCGR